MLREDSFRVHPTRQRPGHTLSITGGTTGEGSASDEPDASRGGSEADDERATQAETGWRSAVPKPTEKRTHQIETWLYRSRSTSAGTS